MRLKYIIKSALLFSLAVVMSCSKDYLDSAPQGGKISSSQLNDIYKVDPSINDGTIRGMYSLMYTAHVGNTGGEDDFGHKSMDIFSDLMSADMALGGTVYGWYSGFISFSDVVDFTSEPNEMAWTYYYRIILAANGVIHRLGGNDADLIDGKDIHSMGQAKTMRAYAYFYLTQLFVNSYDPTSKVIPIYKSLEDVNQPQALTSEVYDLIIDDLTKSIDLLDGFVRSNRSEVNVDIAKSLLAYTYASMGRVNEAKDLAADVIASGYRIVDGEEALEGMNDINVSDWMWGVDLTLDMGIDIVSWWGHMDIYTYGYPSVGDTKAMDQNLYDQIPANDVRKKQFLNYSGHIFHLAPYNKFYDSNREIDGQLNVTTDYFYMRIAEIYLLHAEVAAKSGDEMAAKTSLKELLKNRFEDASDYSYVDSLTGQALLDEIYLQTRIELWGEGKIYFAMKRNMQTVTRGPNHLLLQGESFSYDDDRLTLKIPESEIQNNPNIN